MFRTMGRRAIASTVGFFLGWIVFMIATPVKTVPLFEAPPIQVLSITLKHQGCTDSELKCPVYDLTFHNDGTTVYTGYANDDFMGKHTAHISPQDFKYLTEQLEKQRFSAMPPRYATDPTEEIVVLEVVTNQGFHQVMTHNWSSTPFELRALQATIAEQVYHMNWEEAE
jgi:hypothetical protein